MTSQELRERIIQNTTLEQPGLCIQFPPDAKDAEGWIDLERAEYLWVTDTTARNKYGPFGKHRGWEWEVIPLPFYEDLYEFLSGLAERDTNDPYGQAYTASPKRGIEKWLREIADEDDIFLFERKEERFIRLEEKDATRAASRKEPEQCHRFTSQT